jgi:hypothetical protein
MSLVMILSPPRTSYASALNTISIVPDRSTTSSFLVVRVSVMLLFGKQRALSTASLIATLLAYEVSFAIYTLIPESAPGPSHTTTSVLRPNRTTTTLLSLKPPPLLKPITTSLIKPRQPRIRIRYYTNVAFVGRGWRGG